MNFIERVPGAVLRATLASAVLAALAGGLAVGGVATGSTPAASAQSAGPATGQRHRMAQMLMSLGLSDDQKSRIRDIMKGVRAQNQTQNADPETRRANQKAGFAKIDGVLTPDQRTKLHAEMDQMRKDRGQNSP